MSSAVGAFIPYPDRLRAAVERKPDRMALVDDHRSLTYAELVARAEAFAARLSSSGLEPGACIAICGANSVDYAVAYVGAVLAGVIVAPLPQSATVESLRGMLADCGAALVLADGEARERLVGAPSEVQLEPLEGLTGRLQTVQRAPQPTISPDGIFNIIYSSGTTGTPKGIIQANGMRNAHVELAQACGYDGDTVTLISTPLYSNTTLVSFLPTLALGGTAVLMRKFDAQGFLARSEEHRVTHAMLVPVQYRRLMQHDRFASFDLSAYREKFCTSAPFDAELKREVLDRWPGGLTEYYGMTEGGGLSILFAHRHPEKLHTVGQPAPLNDIRIIDETGRELPRSEKGEIVGRSRSIMIGYHNRPDATADAFWSSPEGEQFVRSGDIGRFDEDGFLILMDRKKDVIISGGFNIYPSDLEEAIRAHPAVTDAAVVGVPSKDWGETPAAFVVASSAPAEEIRTFANARLGRHQRIAQLYLVDRLPRSAIGKVLKRELREQLESLGENV